MKQRAPIYRQIWELFRQDGHIRPGTGMISGVIALFLAILAVLGVLAFHFPAYLTTPELRAFYSVDAMRALLFGALLVSGTIALANIVLGRQRWLNIAAFALVCGAVRRRQPGRGDHLQHRPPSLPGPGLVHPGPAGLQHRLHHLREAVPVV